MSVNYHSLRIPLHRLAPVRTLIKDSSISAGSCRLHPSAPGRSFSHGLVASLPLLGSAASLVAKADMQDSAQPGALQDSEASKFEELELQAEE